MRKNSITRSSFAVGLLLVGAGLASPGFADTLDCWNGAYRDPKSGATLQIQVNGSALVATGVGGRGHESLRVHYVMKPAPGGASWTGTYTNEEGVVRGSGTATFALFGSATEFDSSFDGNWSGGGGGGHVSGKTRMERAGPGRCG